jgi:putative ribosome biogenesis GTPase RsgA
MIFLHGNENKYIISPKNKEIETKICISKTKNPCKIHKLEDFIVKKINYVKYNGNSLYFFSEDRESLLNILKRRKYTFLCGPSGIGKTVTLLKLRAMDDYNVLYFNLKSLTYYYDFKQIKENIY